MFKLEKRGFIFKTNKLYDWAVSHTYMPTPDVRDTYIRIYLAFWDENKVGQIGFIDVDIDNPSKILNICRNPVLKIGKPGRFDDNGVSPSYMKNKDGVKILFYIGWQLGVTVPYHLFSGVATTFDDGETFQASSDVPYLDRLDGEAFARSAPMIVIETDSLLRKNSIYYFGASKWMWDPTHNRYWYDSEIKLLASPKRAGIPVNIPKSNTFGHGRPWVIWDGNRHHMFFVYRTFEDPTKYKQGYGVSENGINFDVTYDTVIPFGKDGDFDSEAASHLVVVPAGGRLVGFYMGNDFGREGMGWCEVEVY